MLEAKAASALNHPNIVTIYEIGTYDGADFIAMEFVDGKTLEELIPKQGMAVKDGVRLAVQIVDALAKAHGAGIVHRDLKPSNIMVDGDGRVRVLDFGQAKLTDRGSRLAGMQLCQRIGATASCRQILQARRLSISACRGTGALLPVVGFTKMV